LLFSGARQDDLHPSAMPFCIPHFLGSWELFFGVFPR